MASRAERRRRNELSQRRQKRPSESATLTRELETKNASRVRRPKNQANQEKKFCHTLHRAAARNRPSDRIRFWRFICLRNFLTITRLNLSCLKKLFYGN